MLSGVFFASFHNFCIDGFKVANILANKANKPTVVFRQALSFLQLYNAEKKSSKGEHSR